MKILIQLIKDIYNNIYETFFQTSHFEVKRDGLIFIGKTLIKTIEIEKIIKIILKLIKKIEKESYETFFEKSKNVDEFLINLNILITFETEEGYRAEDKKLMRAEFKINKIDYKEIETLTRKSLISLFEEYNINEIEYIIVKLF